MKYFTVFLRHGLLCAGALIMVLPFIIMLSTSLKTQADIYAGTVLRLIPDQWAVKANFTEALINQPMLDFLLNGLLVAVSIFSLQLCVAVPCAYALAKLRFRGRNALFGLILWALLIPPQVVALPVFLELHAVNQLNSYTALILPWTISVLGIFLLRQFFVAIPDAIFDAARLDGLSDVGIMLHIAMPLAVPALTSFGILSLISHWNDFFWPLICLQDITYYTPPLGIVFFKNEDAGIEYGPLMAAACVAVLPLILIFLANRHRFIQGVSLQSAVK